MGNSLAASHKSRAPTDVSSKIWSPGDQVGANIVRIKDALARGGEIRWDQYHDAGILGAVLVWLR